MKLKNHIEIIESENGIECLIKNKRTSTVVVIFLGIIGFIIPLAVFVSSFIYNFNIGFGFIFTILFGFGTSYYFTRLILWNTVGLEKFLISNKTAEYYCDFKIFKRNEKTIKSPFTVEYRTDNKQPENDYKENNYGRLLIISLDDKIESQFDIPVKYLESLLTVINSKINL